LPIVSTNPDLCFAKRVCSASNLVTELENILSESLLSEDNLNKLAESTKKALRDIYSPENFFSEIMSLTETQEVSNALAEERSRMTDRKLAMEQDFISSDPLFIGFNNLSSIGD